MTALDNVRALQAEVEAMRAARIAYASEFSPNADGEPDLGNIHANIRALKAEIAALRKERDDALATAGDYGMVRDLYDAARAEVEALREERNALAEVLPRGPASVASELAALRHDIARHVAIAAEQAEEIERLRAELQNIANANPNEWEPDVRDQFQQWAQSRARAALAIGPARGE